MIINVSFNSICLEFSCNKHDLSHFSLVPELNADLKRTHHFCINCHHGLICVLIFTLDLILNEILSALWEGRKINFFVIPFPLVATVL